MKPNKLNTFSSKPPFSAFEARKTRVNATWGGDGGGGRKADEVLVEGLASLVSFERLETAGDVVVLFVEE